MGFHYILNRPRINGCFISVLYLDLYLIGDGTSVSQGSIMRTKHIFVLLYFLRQTFNIHESHIRSFLTHFSFICYNDTNFRLALISRANSLITLPPLTLTSFKTMDVTLKHLRFLNIGFVTLYQERTSLIISTRHTVHRQQTS